MFGYLAVIYGALASRFAPPTIYPLGDYVGSATIGSQPVEAKLTINGRATFNLALAEGKASGECEDQPYRLAADGTFALGRDACAARSLRYGVASIAYLADDDVVVLTLGGTIDRLPTRLRLEHRDPDDYQTEDDDDERYHGQGELGELRTRATPPRDIADFLRWTVKYGKSYPSNDRFNVAMVNWRESVVAVERHNADASTTYTMEANAFSDMAPRDRAQAMYPSRRVRASAPPQEQSDEAWTAFHHWLLKHAKLYEDAGDVELRFSNFKTNDNWIQDHNGLGKTYQVGHNRMSDTSAEERKLMLSRPMPEREEEPNYDRAAWLEQVEDVPPSVDWQRALPPVRDQGACGSCWTYAATGALSGAYYLKTKKVVDFSTGELTQCDSGGSGCGGGLMTQAFSFCQEHGIQTAAAYPYTSGGGVTGTCDETKAANPFLPTISGYTELPPRRLDLLAAALSKQPIAIALEADTPGFHFYHSGIYDAEGCGTALDHGVVLVGMDQDADGAYWRVQNSWTAAWGELGYIRIKRDIDAKRGSGPCGMALSASFPVL